MNPAESVLGRILEETPSLSLLAGEYSDLLTAYQFPQVELNRTTVSTVLKMFNLIFIISGLMSPIYAYSFRSLRMVSTSNDVNEKFTHVPGLENVIRPSIVDKARTITHVCTSGTLCTLSADSTMPDVPFGSYVDYVIDQNGWPILLLSDQSLHSQNIRHNPSVSLFTQLPRSHPMQQTAALSRVTILGKIQDLVTEEKSSAKYAFTLVHTYADQIADSPKFKFCKIKPEKIYFSGGFGVAATWVDVTEYELAKPDVLAQEVAAMLAKLNADKRKELSLLAKHFLGVDPQLQADVRVQAVDHLGVDLRVKGVGESPYTDEYRIGFRHPVKSAEDAKSELVKLFQECWEREQGFYYDETLPQVTKYAEDILRTR